MKKTIDEFVNDKDALDSIVNKYISEINFGGFGTGLSAANRSLSTMGQVAGNYTPAGIVATGVHNTIKSATSPTIHLSKGLGAKGLNPAGLVMEIVRGYLARKLVGSTPEERQVVTNAAKSLIQQKLQENGGKIPVSGIKAFAVEVIRKVLRKESLISEEDKGAPDVPFGPYVYNTTAGTSDLKTHIVLAKEEEKEKKSVIEPTPKVKELLKGDKKILNDDAVDNEEDDDDIPSIDFNEEISDNDPRINGLDNEDDEAVEEQITIIQHAPKETKKDKKEEKEAEKETEPTSPDDQSQMQDTQDLPDEENPQDPSQQQENPDYQGDDDLGVDPETVEQPNEGGEDEQAQNQDPSMQQQDPNMMQQDPNAAQDPNMAMQDPSMQQDPNAMGGDPSMMGQDPNAMGGMQDPNAPLPGAQNSEQLGRTFELKKIYNRLIAIETYLSFSTEPILLKIEQYVSKSIELFELVMTNIQMYLTKIDDILVTYYKFLEKVYDVIKQYYALKKEKEEDNEEGE